MHLAKHLEICKIHTKTAIDCEKNLQQGKYKGFKLKRLKTQILPTITTNQNPNG